MGNAKQALAEQENAPVNNIGRHAETSRWLGEVTTIDTDASFAGVSVGGEFHDDMAAKIAEIVGIKDYEE